jgi:DNA-binding transcriptional MocR family regulator
VRAPSGIVARLAAAKAAADLGSTAYHQGLVAAVVAGQHDAIVKWRAEWTRSRYDAVAAALRSFLPAWDWAPPSGGLTIWARLPGSPDSSAFAQAALRRGVAVVPGRLLSAAGGGRSHLRLAFTSSPERLTAAVMALASV